MATKHPLDNHDARTAVITSVSSGGSLADAGVAAGVTKTRLSRYLKANEDFAREVALARHRGEIAAHHASRMLPPAPDGTPPDDPAYPEPSSPEGRAKLMGILWLAADDADHKGCSKALDVLAQLAFAPEILAIQAKVKLEALDGATAKTDTRPVIIRHGTPPPRVVDAELIERPPRLDS